MAKPIRSTTSKSKPTAKAKVKEEQTGSKADGESTNGTTPDSIPTPLDQAIIAPLGSEPEAKAKRTTKPKAVAAKRTVKPTTAAPRKATAAPRKVAATPRKTKRATVAAEVSATLSEAPVKTFTTDEIALRAYFIAQDRHSRGAWGTPEGDWLEAERQLREEAGL